MKLDRRPALLALASLILIASMTEPALADPKRDDAEKRAQKLFQVGDDHYAAGRYEEAVVQFQQAYELSQQPALLLLLLRDQPEQEAPLERASLQFTPSLGSAGLGLEVSGAF